ncbi:cytochrome c-type biogenesis CcmH-like mitochondrial protein [Rutidosis leptorrhynchoides]|uniref:cytochrome c-type biogenesis CcmH-like mitochondrial protein n=1 Tax=Rutidosis leptorrhynchoides TaxID=125765 RepID=UPI003A98F137
MAEKSDVKIDRFDGTDFSFLEDANGRYALSKELIRGEIRSGKSDKDIYKKLERNMGRQYFTLQSSICRLVLLIAATAGGIWAYGRHRQRTNVHLLALNLMRRVPLTRKEKETMIEILTPPPSQGILPSFPWWKQWFQKE